MTRKIVLTVSVTLALALAGFAGYAGLEAYRVYKAFAWEPARRTEMAKLAAHRARLLEDQRFAATLPLLAPRRGGRDAGPVIGPRVRWEATSPDSLARYRSELSEALRHATLDPALVSKAKDAKLDLDADAWSGVDLAWMAELDRFDFWDLDANSPSPEPSSLATSHPRPWRPSSVPEPQDLVAWARLRGAKGLHERAPVPAIRDIEALARLCMTTENLTGILTGEALLGIANDVRARAAASGGTAGDPGKPLGADARLRLRRATWATLAYGQAWNSGQFDADWPLLTVGRCAALRDGLSLTLWLRPVLGDELLTDQRRLERLLASTPECRLTRLRAQVAAGSVPVEASAEAAMNVSQAYLALLPTFQADPFSLYDRDRRVVVGDRVGEAAP